MWFSSGNEWIVCGMVYQERVWIDHLSVLFWFQVICYHWVMGQLVFPSSLSLLQVCTRRLLKPRGFIDSESEAVMSRWCLPPAPFSERRPGLFWKGSLSHPNELHPADGRDHTTLSHTRDRKNQQTTSPALLRAGETASQGHINVRSRAALQCSWETF